MSPMGWGREVWEGRTDGPTSLGLFAFSVATLQSAPPTPRPSPEQPRKAPRPTVRLPGSETSVSPMQCANAPSPMEVTDPGIMMTMTLEQLMKAPLPMEVTDLGIVMAVALEQSMNAQ